MGEFASLAHTPLSARRHSPHVVAKSRLRTMSGYSGGRKAPNVSQYLANLNTVTSPTDLSSMDHDGFGLDDDMNLFTNTEFFDFDSPGLANGEYGGTKRQRTD
ncbi:MAG: hypothetical protein INR71_06035, partial [Terriglobus roseus]|nr:hypothetical protein [Terriglobus roseus]